MTISNLKELEALVKMCKRQGIDAIKIDNIEFAITHRPKEQKLRKSLLNDDISNAFAPPTITPGGITEDTKIETDELTDEQLLFYSARPEIQEATN